MEQTQAISLDLEEESEHTKARESEQVWGRLVSLNPSYPSIDLVSPEMTMGRHSVCSFRFDKDERLISGRHCRIYRDSKQDRDMPGVIAFIQDLSTNGTYLNHVKIGQHNTMLLQNNAEITLMPAKEGKGAIGYIFKDMAGTKVKEHEAFKGGPEAVYDIRETLGTGNFASVKLGIHRKTGERVAVKVIDKKKYLKQAGAAKKDSLMDEVNILRRCKHAGIIGIREVFDTEKTMFIILELVTGGELFDDIVDRGHYSEQRAFELFIQMCEAVKYLHGNGIIHRDLKPENILFLDKKKDQLKISDFGLSRALGEGSFAQTMCGTPQYIAPEILMNAEQKGYGPACDCWSMGAILYVMLCGAAPFDEGRGSSIFEQIRTGKLVFDEPAWTSVSEEAKDLIRCLLTVDPKRRYTAEKALKHPWVAGGSLAEFHEEQRREAEREEAAKRKRDAEETNAHAQAHPHLHPQPAQNKVQPHPNNSKPSPLGAAMEIERAAKTPTVSPASSFTRDASSEDVMVMVKKRRLDGSADSSPDSDYADEEVAAPAAVEDRMEEAPEEEESEATQVDMQRPLSASGNSSGKEYNGKTLSREDSQGSTDMEIEAQKSLGKSASSSPSVPFSSSSSNSSSGPAASQVANDPRPVCKYGAGCYRKNPQHFQQFHHPHLVKK